MCWLFLCQQSLQLRRWDAWSALKQSIHICMTSEHVAACFPKKMIVNNQMLALLPCFLHSSWTFWGFMLLWRRFPKRKAGAARICWRWGPVGCLPSGQLSSSRFTARRIYELSSGRVWAAFKSSKSENHFVWLGKEKIMAQSRIIYVCHITTYIYIIYIYYIYNIYIIYILYIYYIIYILPLNSNRVLFVLCIIHIHNIHVQDQHPKSELKAALTEKCLKRGGTPKIPYIPWFQYDSNILFFVALSLVFHALLIGFSQPNFRQSHEKMRPPWCIAWKLSLASCARAAINVEAPAQGVGIGAVNQTNTLKIKWKWINEHQ